MKISELIKDLEDAKGRYGDVDVRIQEWFGYATVMNVVPAYFWEEEGENEGAGVAFVTFDGL